MATPRQVIWLRVAVGTFFAAAGAGGCVPPITQGCSEIDGLVQASGAPGAVITAYGTVNPTHVLVVTIGDTVALSRVDPLSGVLFEVPDLPPNLYEVTIRDTDCPEQPIAGPFLLGIVAP